MDWFLIGARLALAALFLIAGLAKLLDRRRSAASLARFGVPAPLIRPASVALPAAELLVALGLLLASTAQAASVAAFVLLGTFAAVTAVAGRRGDEFECGCFGSLHSERIGAPMIVRVAALAMVALLVASHAAQPAIDDWLARRRVTDVVVLGLAVALAGILCVAGAFWRKNRVLSDAARPPAPPKPPPVGSRAPGFRLEDVSGTRITLKSLLRDSRPIAFLFLSPDCGSCHAVLPDISRWQVSLARDLPIHVVSSGGHEQTRAMANAHHLDRVLIDSGGAVAKRYGVRNTPAALIVDGEARVAAAPAAGHAAIEALIRRALSGDRESSPRVGKMDGPGAERKIGDRSAVDPSIALFG